MFDVSVDGLLHSLQVFQPRRVVFSSSCAVYGNSPLEGASPTWQDVHPISVYGLSKAAAEKVLEQWARQTRSVAVLVRMGNVVGSGCAGLISYLVRHAVQHPDGTVPANMRGGGKIVRDYVPVSYVVQIVRMALEEDFEPGSAPVLNAGSGRTVSNGEVASILKEWLAKQGYRLNIVFQPNAAPSEASYTALRTELTECRFNLNSPSSEAVREAILDGARSCLTQLTSSTLSSQASV